MKPKQFLSVSVALLALLSLWPAASLAQSPDLLPVPSSSPPTCPSGTSEADVLTASSDWTWQIEVVDATGDMGRYASLALDTNNRPRIAYYASDNGNLKYAAYDGTAWQIEVVDATGDVGRYASLALEWVGLPHIAYYDATNVALKHAYKGATWTTEQVSTSPGDGQYSSLALNASGLPRIAFYNFPGGNLRHAYFDGLFWQAETVDTGGDVGRYASLALNAVNGFSSIAYYDATGKNLKYAANNGAAWWPMTVDVAGDVGQYASLALDGSGVPYIAYYDATNGDLKVAYNSGMVWITETVDVAGDVGQYASLELDGSGFPHIAYYDATSATLKYTHFDGTTWQIETVDTAGDVGQYASLSLDAQGFPHIAYYDATSGDLKYASPCIRAGFAHTPEPACAGDTVTFANETVGPGPFTYLWGFGDGYTSTLENPTHIYTATGLYTAWLTATAECGVSVATETVSIWGPPQSNFTYTTPACAGEPVQFVNTTAGSGTLSYYWAFGDGGFSFLENPTHTYAYPAEFVVTLLATGLCGQDSHQEVLTAHSGPTAIAFSWQPDPPEVLNPITFTAQATSTLPVTFTWDFGDGFTGTGQVTTHTYRDTGVYTVTLVGDNGCGVKETSAMVSVICTPISGTAFTWEPLTPTVGSPAVFTATAEGTAPFTFTWDFGDGISGTGQVVAHTYAATGTYTVMLLGQNYCGEETVSETLSVQALPQAGFLHSAPVCLGEAVVFTNTSGGAEPLSFLWDFGDGITATLESPTHTYAAADAYTVTLHVENPYGEDEASDRVEVRAPITGLGMTWSPEMPEPGGVVTFTAEVQTGTEPLSYTWAFGDGFTGTGQVVTHVYAVTGTYTVTLSAENLCGEANITATVEVAHCVGPADLAVVYAPQPAVAGRPVVLTATLGAGTEPLTYYWLFGDGSPPATGAVVSHTYQSAGSYTATVAVWNGCGSLQEGVPVEVVAPVYRVYLPLVTKGYWYDRYEPDDTPGEARPLGLGEIHRHGHYPNNDVDWVYLDLQSGATYYIHTFDLQGRADTRIFLYRSGEYDTPITYNDDCNPAVRWDCITWTADQTGRYYLKIEQSPNGPPYYGLRVRYKLEFTEQ